ncbi:MAG TPA: DedA family protein [Streptosporangiaceae bacterium]|nr:DedA family protein [Streptosporangiaceae bacterium]
MEHFLTSYGYLALIIFGFVEACSIPISSEITFATAGALAATHHQFSLVLVIVIGTLAEMGGSLTSYWIGRRSGHQFIDKYGRFVLVSHSDLDRAERFFAGRGTWTVAVARLLPLVRCFASLGAGIVEVPFTPFAIFGLIGTAIWATALSMLGYSVGSTMTKLFHSFSLIGVALIVLFVLALVGHWLLGRRRDARRQQALAQAPGTEEIPAPAEAKVTSGRPAGAHRSTRGPTA